MNINKLNGQYDESFTQEMRNEVEKFFNLVAQHIELPAIEELADGYEIETQSCGRGYANMLIGAFLMYVWTHPVLKDWDFSYDEVSLVLYVAAE